MYFNIGSFDDQKNEFVESDIFEIKLIFIIQIELKDFIINDKNKKRLFKSCCLSERLNLSIKS
jgi:hypothetical protein